MNQKTGGGLDAGTVEHGFATSKRREQVDTETVAPAGLNKQSHVEGSKLTRSDQAKDASTSISGFQTPGT